jgi:hypothetical protein
MPHRTLPSGDPLADALNTSTAEADKLRPALAHLWDEPKPCLVCNELVEWGVVCCCGEMWHWDPPCGWKVIIQSVDHDEPLEPRMVAMLEARGAMHHRCPCEPPDDTYLWRRGGHRRKAV